MSTLPPPPDNTKSSNICQVCGDNASIINYGALTCASCRTFFRRNGFNTQKTSPCRYKGTCEMSVSTRRHCTTCRLAKCLAVGMSADLIRKEDLSGTKRKLSESANEELVEHQPVTTPQQVLSLGLQTDDSCLNSSDWTIISNVVHAFDTFSPVADIRRTIETINTSASNVQFDLSHSLQITSSFLNSLQLFISSTPDFKVLTISEQWCLLQRNIFGLLSIGGSYLMRESGIFDKPENEVAVLPLYGDEAVQKLKTLSTKLDCDPIIIKLTLVAVAFSSNCFIKDQQGNIDKDSLLLGTFRLFGTQNVYIELIWKYSMHRYNHNAVQRFSVLVKRLMDILTLLIEVYENNKIFQTFIDDVIQEVEQSPVINDKTTIPLWGKS